MNRYAVTMSLALLGMSAQCVLAQNYPIRPIRLVVPSSPGGSSDILARILAQKLGDALGQQVVVDNRAGASGVIGVDLVAKAAPDGYTLVLTQTSIAINPSMFKKLPYDAMRDLAPISRIVEGPNLLAVHPSVPARNVKELIALAKTKPGSLTIASPGLGTSPHLSAELFKFMAGVNILQVLYKGAGQGIVSVLSGEVGVIFSTPPTLIQYVRAGKLRALGVTTKTRIPALPDVPPIADTLPGYEATQWFCVLAPAGTPRAIIDRLHQEIVRVLRAPDLKERLAGEGVEALGTTPEELAGYIKSETEKWAQVIKAAGIRPE